MQGQQEQTETPNQSSSHLIDYLRHETKDSDAVLAGGSFEPSQGALGM